MSLAEKQRDEKAFVMGTCFETGKPINIGVSYKGRIWTKLQGDLKQSAKMAYVGFSRPTDLLCIAIHKDRFDNVLAVTNREEWEIITV